jgi:hypothetical protein
MKAKLPWFLCLALLIITCFLLLTRGGQQGLDPTKKAFEDSITVWRSQQTNTIKAQEEIIKRVSESKAKDSVALRAFKVENSRLKAKISSIHPRVVQILIDNPSVDSLVKTLDTLNQKLEIENSRLQYSLQIQGKEFIDLTVAVDSERRANEKIIMESLARVESLEKQVKKKQKGQKLLKVVAVVGTIGAFVLGSQL